LRADYHRSTPPVLLYLLVVAASPPRLSLRLVWLATAAAGLGYLAALGHYAFVRVGVGTAALLAGQAVRRSLRLAAGGRGAMP
jgi:hypothetical protein